MFGVLAPITLGMTLGTFQQKLLLLCITGALGAGVVLYSITMLCLPAVISPSHITMQYLCIVGGLVATLLYYPLAQLINA